MLAGVAGEARFLARRPYLLTVAIRGGRAGLSWTFPTKAVISVTCAPPSRPKCFPEVSLPKFWKPCRGLAFESISK